MVNLADKMTFRPLTSRYDVVQEPEACRKETIEERLAMVVAMLIECRGVLTRIENAIPPDDKSIEVGGVTAYTERASALAQDVLNRLNVVESRLGHL